MNVADCHTCNWIGTWVYGINYIDPAKSTVSSFILFPFKFKYQVDEVLKGDHSAVEMMNAW